MHIGHDVRMQIFLKSKAHPEMCMESTDAARQVTLALREFDSPRLGAPSFSTRGLLLAERIDFL